MIRRDKKSQRRNQANPYSHGPANHYAIENCSRPIFGLMLYKPRLDTVAICKSSKRTTDYYRYYKDKSAGGIYDTEASESNDDIGSEINASAIWQIFSDLRCTLQYGHFIPGDAYPYSSNDSEDYFSVSVVITF